MKTMNEQWLIALSTVGLGACMGVADPTLEEGAGQLGRMECIDESNRAFQECATKCGGLDANLEEQEQQCKDAADLEYKQTVDNIKLYKAGGQKALNVSGHAAAMHAAQSQWLIKIGQCRSNPVDPECLGEPRTDGIFGPSRRNNTWLIGQLFGKDATGCYIRAEHAYSGCRETCGEGIGAPRSCGTSCAPYQFEYTVPGVIGSDEGVQHRYSMDWLEAGAWKIEEVDEAAQPLTRDGQDVRACMCSTDTTAVEAIIALEHNPDNHMYVPHACDRAAKDAGLAGGDYRYTPKVEFASTGAPVGAKRVCQRWESTSADRLERPTGNPIDVAPPCSINLQEQESTCN